RELRNVIERATILAPGPMIEPRHLPPAFVSEPVPPPQQPQMALAPGTTVEEAERRLIQMTLAHTGDNKTRAAEILDISLKTLHNKLNKLRLRPKRADSQYFHMRLGIKAKQVLGVTTIVGTIVVVLSVMQLARLAEVRLDESSARAELLANAIFQRAHAVVSTGTDPYGALRNDSGLRSILESSLYSNNVTFAAIVDTHGT